MSDANRTPGQPGTGVLTTQHGASSPAAPLLDAETQAVIDAIEAGVAPPGAAQPAPAAPPAKTPSQKRAARKAAQSGIDENFDANTARGGLADAIASGVGATTAKAAAQKTAEAQNPFTPGPPVGMDLSAPVPGYEYISVAEAQAALAKRFALLTGPSGVSVWDMYSSKELSVTSFNAKFQRHMHKPPKGPKAAPFWVLVESAHRKELAGTMFWPGASSVYNYYGELWGNLYKGAPSDEVPMTLSAAKHFVRLLRHLFPSGRLGQRPWLRHYLDALAYLYQKPDARLLVAMILTGEQMGSGKTLLMYDLPKAIFGNTTKIGAREIFTSFNKWIGDTRLLFMDELYIDIRNPKHAEFESELREWIMGSDLREVGKGKDGKSILNCVTFFAASNHTDNVLPLDETDRRYAIEETTATSELPNGAAVGALLQQETPTQPAGAGGAMLRWYLRRRDVSGFNPRKMPETAARAAVKRASVAPEQKLIEALMESGSLARGYATLAEVESAVLGTNYRPAEGKLHSDKWGRLLKAAAKSRGLIYAKKQIDALPTRPVYHVWGRDTDELRAATARCQEAILSLVEVHRKLKAEQKRATEKKKNE